MAKGTSGARVHIGESKGSGPSHGGAMRKMLGVNMAPGKQKKFVQGHDTDIMDNRTVGIAPGSGSMKNRESSEE